MEEKRKEIVGKNAQMRKKIEKIVTDIEGKKEE